ncbi:MAG: fatty acid cis/trans isomerase [Vibrio sp.]
MRATQHLLIFFMTYLVSSVTIASEQTSASPTQFNAKSPEFYTQEIKPILDNRCVICHGCYDAPCQLKLSSPEGITRGANQEKVYDGARLLAIEPTRLFEDAHTVDAWRKKNFFPVLNETNQSPAQNTATQNIERSLIAQMLMQKKEHPLPQTKQLDGFDFSINREQTCATIEDYPEYKKDHPSWGMPFGMPAISDEDYSKVMAWIAQGAVMPMQGMLSKAQHAQVNKWEQFFNGDSLKQQLTSRYLYEHLYISHLYFPAAMKASQNAPIQFFNLVRSATPPGQPIQRISTRRPYGDPNVERVYYRLQPYFSTIVDKTHQPYVLDDKRLARYQALFIQPEYEVKQLPSYQTDVAANPLTVFQDLPLEGRYQFLLDDAQNTIMNFIKGPVCRGNIALSVINDRFWVYFVDPQSVAQPEVKSFYAAQRENLRLPKEKSNFVPTYQWVSYSARQAKYLDAKSVAMNTWFENSDHLTEKLIWDGNHTNPNAALTVFRHYDSASVVKGLVGKPPRTAWVIDYALLERIQYLLVDGFDVFGNYGHQLMTRLFMDFLRMEGEQNFLSLLPIKERHAVMESWYQNPPLQLKSFLKRDVAKFDQPTNIDFKTDDHQTELYQILSQRLDPILDDTYEVKHTALSAEDERTLKKIGDIEGLKASYFPEISIIMIEGKQPKPQVFTLLRDTSYQNISSLFEGEDNHQKNQDKLTLVKGLIGSYPEIILRVKTDQISAFYQQASSMQSHDDYIKLLDNFAIRRTSPEFWRYSDTLSQWYKESDPIYWGLLDYNRFNNK